MADDLDTAGLALGAGDDASQAQGKGYDISDSPTLRRHDTRVVQRAVRRGWLGHWDDQKRQNVADVLYLDATEAPTVKERVTAARALAVLDSVDLRREKARGEETKDARRLGVDALKALLASDALRAVLASQDTTSEPTSPSPDQPLPPPEQARQDNLTDPRVG